LNLIKIISKWLNNGQQQRGGMKDPCTTPKPKCIPVGQGLRAFKVHIHKGNVK